MNRFNILIIVRVVLLATSLVILAYIFGKEGYLFNHIIFGGIAVAQILELIHFVNRSNRDLLRLLKSLEHGDFAVTFQQGFNDKSFRDLENGFNRVVEVYKKVKIEKEAQFHLLNTIINHVNAGILAVNADDETLLMNPATEKILGTKAIKSWGVMKTECPELYSAVELIGAFGRKLVELKSDGAERIISVDVTSTTLLGMNQRIIIIQDINNEIEQKEFEAWNKLIRILTHEIMNSVTPISSLTETMRMMLEHSGGVPKRVSELKDDTVSDILSSLKTIEKRSNGMLNFTDAYRTFSRVPTPVVALVKIEDLVDSVSKLMHEELKRKQIDLHINIARDAGEISIDRGLIEQVLINLITNSIHALQNSESPRITINATNTNGRAVIEVTDNGTGIPQKELPHIFVPFYTTRKDGSGIGLSLSKQIMSLHGATIRVTSKSEGGTTFFLKFRA